MSAMIFVNFPVADVEKSTAFYQKLGFTENQAFSTEGATALIWDQHFWIMLLSHDFYQQFAPNKQIIDAKNSTGVIVSIQLDSPTAVQKFAEMAKENGGDFYSVPMGIHEDQMYSLEVLDLDGNILEPIWMLD
ncbi:VOC family protein [Carnobacterium gallinarum]|uniref:VOC family protein n=1 Tax=Carnobacterium gallinarum TaxID=2749 RepID=UPI00055710F4|nr:VOC family protein [Carnobacterium gallinarum]